MPFLLFVVSVSLTEVRIGNFQDTTAKFVSVYDEIEGVDTIETLIFNLTNEERKKEGLEVLELDERLKFAARQHSNDMLKKNYLSHNSTDEMNKTPLQRIYNSGLPLLFIGENVAENVGSAVPFLLKENPDSLAKLVMKGWMESPFHRKNILNSDFTHLGVGAVSQREMLKVTQNFTDESDFALDSVVAKVEPQKYMLLFYISSFLPDIEILDNGQIVEEDSLYIYSGQIGVPLLRDSSLHKVELCLKEQKFYSCGVRLFVHTGPPLESIFQPSSSSYK
jgi:uncharacterized protein YkwD